MSDVLAEAQAASAAPGELEALRRLVRDREALQPGFQAAWLRLRDRAPSLVDSWAGVSLGLVQVNAGPACLAAFWQLCVGDVGSVPAVLKAGRAARAICRHAGARAALACLQTTPTACRLAARDGGGAEGWWQGLERLAEAAPSLVAGLAGQVERLLDEGDAAGFADFVAAGLKATAADPARRRAVFTLADPLAEALLARRPGRPGFAESERMLSAFVAGLWGGRPRLAATGSSGPQRPDDRLRHGAAADGVRNLSRAGAGAVSGRGGACAGSSHAPRRADAAAQPQAAAARAGRLDRGCTRRSVGDRAPARAARCCGGSGMWRSPAAPRPPRA